MPAPLRRILHNAASGALAPRALVSRMDHRVHLTYLDLYLHMNYATYLEVMELGRWHWTFQARAFRPLFVDGRLRPVVVRVDLRYLRELKPGVAFTLETRLVRTEGRVLVFQQIFFVGERAHAVGEVHTLPLRDGEVLSAEEAQEIARPYLVEARGIERDGRSGPLQPGGPAPG